MHILLAVATASFGENEKPLELCDRVQHLLSRAGHHTDRLTLPFVADVDDAMQQVMSYRLLDLAASADRLLTFDAPTHLLRHPNKAVVVSSCFLSLRQLVAGPRPNRSELATQRRLDRASNVAFSEASAAFIESSAVLDSPPPDVPKSLLATAFSLEGLEGDERFIEWLALGTHGLNTAPVATRLLSKWGLTLTGQVSSSENAACPPKVQPPLKIVSRMPRRTA